jgi:hypothetical protein
VSNGRDDWVDAECLALMACDPAQDVVDLLTVPRSTRGIKPLNSNYKNKGSRLLEWRRQRKELALKEEGTEVL